MPVSLDALLAMLEALGAVPGSPLEPAEALTGDRSGLRDRLLEAPPAGARPPLCLLVLFISCVWHIHRGWT